MSENRLMRRNGVWYYRRRVPPALQPLLGKKFIQHSLGTTDKAAAKKLRALEDVKSDALFDAAQTKPLNGEPFETSRPLSNEMAAELVRQYVARTDRNLLERHVSDPPRNRAEAGELIADAEVEVGILRDRTDPRADQWIACTVDKLLGRARRLVRTYRSHNLPS